MLRTIPRMVAAVAVVSVMLTPAMVMAQDLTLQIPALEKDDAASALLPDSIKQSGKIKLGTTAQYPRCEYYAEDGTTMIGFDVDLWTAISQKLGVTMEVTDIDFASLIPGVMSGRFDMAMECISDRAPREEQVTFVDYSFGYGDYVYYLASNEAIKAEDYSSLCGLHGVGQSGTVSIDILGTFSTWCTNRNLPAVEISEVSAAAAVWTGINAGRYDFTINSSFPDDLAKTAAQPLGHFVNALTEQVYMGMIVNKENTQLAESLLAALRLVIDEGIYDQIWDKWGVGHAKLHDPGINLATTRPLEQPEI